jgi:serine/threonine protein kinase
MPEDSSRRRFLGREWETVRQIASAKGMKPDILILEREGERLVAKDFRNKNFFARCLWGPLNLRYEKFILDRLDGVSDIPRVIGFEDCNCLLLSWLDGEGIKARSQQLDEEFFPRLFAIIEALHERGVLHLDLGHKSNIMVDAAGRPKVIDFNISLYLPPYRWLRPLFTLLARIDHYSVLRLKVKYRPQDCSPREQKQVKRFLRLRRLWIFDGLVRKLTNLGKSRPSR